LEYAASAAEGFQILRAVGNEAEMELPFAALQQLARGRVRGSSVAAERITFVFRGP